MKRFNPYLSGLIIALFAIVSCSQNQPGSGGSSLSNLPAGIITIKSNNGDQIAVGSRYTINNNEWNSQYASAPSSENVFMGSNKGSMYFGWQWSWNNSNNYNVLAYPEVFCGNSPWAPATNHPADFPFSITGHQVKSSFDINQTTWQNFGGDTYDLAYDIWVISNTSDPASYTSTDIKCEIMIWLANANSIPDGLSPTGSLNANGYNFNYYYSPPGRFAPLLGLRSF